MRYTVTELRERLEEIEQDGDKEGRIDPPFAPVHGVYNMDEAVEINH